MQSMFERAVSAARNNIASCQYQCDRLGLRVDNGTRALMSVQRHRLELIAGKIDAASPERILRQGYTMTLVNGHVAGSAALLHKGDSVVLRFADGSAAGMVDDVELNND